MRASQKQHKQVDPVEAFLKKLRRIDGNMICPNCGTKAQPGIGFGDICIKFKTFICSLCKTSHQAISHRVKSITMSTWTMDEVNDLASENNGGNDYARSTWLAAAPGYGERYAGGCRPKAGDKIDVFKQFILDCYEHEKFKSLNPVSNSRIQASHTSSSSSSSSTSSSSSSRYNSNESSSSLTSHALPTTDLLAFDPFSLSSNDAYSSTLTSSSSSSSSSDDILGTSSSSRGNSSGTSSGSFLNFESDPFASNTHSSSGAIQPPSSVVPDLLSFIDAPVVTSSSANSSQMHSVGNNSSIMMGSNPNMVMGNNCNMMMGNNNNHHHMMMGNNPSMMMGNSSHRMMCNNPIMTMNSSPNMMMGNNSNSMMMGNNCNMMMGNNPNMMMMGSNSNSMMMGNNSNSMMMGNNPNMMMMGNNPNMMMMGNNSNSMMMGNNSNSMMMGNNAGMHSAAAAISSIRNTSANIYNSTNRNNNSSSNADVFGFVSASMKQV